MPALRPLEALADGLDALLVTYAQVLFSRSRAVGALLLGASAVDARTLLFGLGGVAVASALAGSLGVRRTGSLGPNALLVALGAAHAQPSVVASMAVAALGAALVVLTTSSLESLFARASLPTLSLPFVVVHLALISLEAPHAHAAVHGPLEAAGALFFLPRSDAGLFVLVALVVHSRIAAVLAALGGATAAALAGPLGAEWAPWALNASLAAVALGGVWFVPSPSSFALALAGALATTLTALALDGPFVRLGWSASILPFNLAVLCALLATRQRLEDKSPKAVDFIPGTPEANLAFYETRRARFSAPYAVAIRLPFRGGWVCTQAVDGPHTHKGVWRHAYDFEVRDADGALHSGLGAQNADHHCFHLPVLAAADGVVEKVVDGVPDNAVGELELARNWGNVVVVCHAPGLYSLVAHLANGSVRVRAGQPVRRGDVLGQCGSSGRSPRPHLHFQLQGSVELGAPTLPCRFSDVVLTRATGEEHLQTHAPREGDALRAVEGNEELRALCSPQRGAAWTFREGARAERVEHHVELLGALVLRSSRATLAFSATEDSFVVFDPLGEASSALHLLRAALPSLPLDAAPLEWRDFVPVRWAGRSWTGPLRDLIAPLFPRPGLAMRYRARREGETLVVAGESEERGRTGPRLTTRARLTARGVVSLEVTSGGTTRSAMRDDDELTIVDESTKRRSAMNVQRVKGLGLAVLIAAGCARASLEGPHEQAFAEPSAAPAPVVSPVLGTGAEAPTALQKSYDDEAAGNVEAALGDLSSIATTGVAQYTTELRRGWLLYRLGKHTDSVAAYARAAALEPGATEPKLGALLPLGVLRRWVDVEAAARDVLRKDPANYTATLRLAFALYSQARWAESEASYRSLVALYPGDVEVRGGLGWALLKGGKVVEAQGAFAEVLAVAPKNALAIEGAAAARR